MVKPLVKSGLRVEENGHNVSGILQEALIKKLDLRRQVR